MGERQNKLTPGSLMGSAYTSEKGEDNSIAIKHLLIHNFIDSSEQLNEIGFISNFIGNMRSPRDRRME